VRAVHLVTTYDNEVIIPHSRLWSKKISNATSGGHSLLCVADFYLQPDHDARAAQQRLAEVAEASSYPHARNQGRGGGAGKTLGYALHAEGLREGEPRAVRIRDPTLTIRGKEALRAMNLRFAQGALCRGRTGALI